MTTTDTTVSNLIINTMTQAQYNQITPSANELYLVTDSTITSSEVTSALGYTPENQANKVTSISSSSTDTQYPSAKCVYYNLPTVSNGDGISVTSGRKTTLTAVCSNPDVIVTNKSITKPTVGIDIENYTTVATSIDTNKYTGMGSIGTYYIYNGCLFTYAKTQIEYIFANNEYSDWDMVEQYGGNLSSKVSSYAVGRRNGNLYRLTANINSTSSTEATGVITTTQIGVGKSWYKYSVNEDGVVYAVSDDGLYSSSLLGDGEFRKIDNSTDWTILSHNYGIKNGELYYFRVEDIARVGTSSNWTHVVYNAGICNGELFSLSGTATTQRGSSSNWTDISSIRQIVYGDIFIYFLLNSNNDLYVMASTGTSAPTLNHSNTSLTFLNGNYSISNGELYYLGNGTTSSLTRIGSDNDWDYVFGGYYSYPGGGVTLEYLCGYAIRNNKLYRLKGTTATELQPIFSKDNNIVASPPFTVDDNIQVNDTINITFDTRYNYTVKTTSTLINDLLNNGGIKTVTQFYKSGTSWYRVWSDGFIEQGGRTVPTADTNLLSITFPKAFTNSTYPPKVITTHNYKDTTGYTANTSNCTNRNATLWSCTIGLPTTTGFVVNRVSASWQINWYACGY